MVKFGYVSILGRPNAGKSTLTNAIIGEKVSIVSAKPQTTRNNILGIYNRKDTQIVFVDTPGIHQTKNKLDKFMMKNVRSALDGVDVLLYMFDASKEISSSELKYFKNLCDKCDNIVAVLNKADKIKTDKRFLRIKQIADLNLDVEIVPISALTNKNVDTIIEIIIKLLPTFSDKTAFCYPEDEYTDKSIRFMISEIVREKALANLNEEIPHGVAVVVSSYRDTETTLFISIDIVCEKDSHKGIVIGKNGETLKKIVSSARDDIQKLVNKKCMLTTWVKVKENWRNKEGELSDFGYLTDNE